MTRCIFILLVFMGISNQAFGKLVLLTPKQLEQIFAKTGVEIFINDIQIEHTFEKLWYTDPDGLGSYIDDQGASIVIKNFSMKSSINAITSYHPEEGLKSIGNELSGEYRKNFNYMNSDSQTTFQTRVLTIEVLEELPVLTRIKTNNRGKYTPVEGIRNKLPTIEIVTRGVSFSIKIEDTNPLDEINNLASVNRQRSYGRISMEKSTTVILDGNIEITAH